MNIENLFDILSNEEKKRIAERVYEEEFRKLFEDDVKLRNPEIFTSRSMVYERVLTKYIDEMNLVHEDFIPYFKEIIHTRSLELLDENSAFSVVYPISSKLQKLTKEVIEEDSQELKEIVREKVFKCCNETLLMAFLSDIVRGLNLNEAVKKILKESYGDKK